MLYSILSSMLSAAHISAEHICLPFQVQISLSLFLSLVFSVGGCINTTYLETISFVQYNTRQQQYRTHCRSQRYHAQSCSSTTTNGPFGCNLKFNGHTETNF